MCGWRTADRSPSLYRFVCFLAHAMGPGPSLPLTSRGRGGSFPRRGIAAADPVVYAPLFRWATVGSRKTRRSGCLAPRSWRSFHPADNPHAAAPGYGSRHPCWGSGSISTFRGGQATFAGRWPDNSRCCQSTSQRHPGIYERRAHFGHETLCTKLAPQLPGSRARVWLWVSRVARQIGASRQPGTPRRPGIETASSTTVPHKTETW